MKLKGSIERNVSVGYSLKANNFYITLYRYMQNTQTKSHESFTYWMTQSCSGPNYSKGQLYTYIILYN